MGESALLSEVTTPNIPDKQNNFSLVAQTPVLLCLLLGRRNGFSEHDTSMRSRSAYDIVTNGYVAAHNMTEIVVQFHGQHCTFFKNIFH